MQMILDHAAYFGLDTILSFLVVRTRSRSIYIIGRNFKLRKRVNLQLCPGSALFPISGTSSTRTGLWPPWKERCSFTGRSLEVRDAFKFTAATKVFGAGKVFASGLYGRMLRWLDSQKRMLWTASRPCGWPGAGAPA